MNPLKLIKRKKYGKHSEFQTKYKELESSWDYFADKKYTESIRECEKYVNHKNKKLRQESVHLKAISNFHLENYKEASKYFEALSNETKSINDIFNVVTSSTMAGFIEKGEKYIKIIENSNFSKMFTFNRKHPPIHFMYFYYSKALLDQKEYTRSYEQISKLCEIYISLKITDDTFLYIRGVPFFHETIDTLKEIYINQNGKMKMRSLLKRMLENVDDDGKKYIEKNFSNL